MLPEVFRDCQVQRLALFFQRLRETLRSIAPHDRDNPRIVLLTPGPVQRDLLRARLPRPLPGLHAGRGERPDGPRQPGLPEAARRAPAGRRHPPPARRQLLRPAGAAPRLVPGRAGAGPGGAGGERGGGQRAGERPGRVAGDAGLPPRALPQPARRGAEDAVGPDLVVRRPRRPRPCPGQPAADGDQADVRLAAIRADLRRGAERCRTSGPGRDDPRAAGRVRRPGAVAALDGPGARRRRPAARGTSCSAPSWRPRNRALRGHARRPDADRRARPTRWSSRCRKGAGARTPGSSPTAR